LEFRLDFGLKPNSGGSSSLPIVPPFGKRSLHRAYFQRKPGPPSREKFAPPTSPKPKSALKTFYAQDILYYFFMLGMIG
jgi:hypothetical protein